MWENLSSMMFTSSQTGKKNTPEVWLNKSCCNITTCVEMAKFQASEKGFSNNIMCEKCKLRVCNSCNLANSHLNITEKIKYIQYWNSIKIDRHDSWLRIQSDYFYKNDQKIVFKPDTLKSINYYKLSGKSLKSLAEKHSRDINPDNIEPDMVTLTS